MNDRLPSQSPDRFLRPARSGKQPHDRQLIALDGLGEISGDLLDRLDNLRSECGCTWGARAMVAGGVTSLGLIAVLCHTLGGFLIHAPISIGVAILTAGLGKAIAITAARRRYRRELSALLNSSNVRAWE